MRIVNVLWCRTFLFSPPAAILSLPNSALSSDRQMRDIVLDLDKTQVNELCQVLLVGDLRSSGGNALQRWRAG